MGSEHLQWEHCSTSSEMPPYSGVIYPPEFPGRRLFYRPTQVVFELAGMPKIGKTSLAEKITDMFDPPLNHVRELVPVAVERGTIDGVETFGIEVIKRAINMEVLNTVHLADTGRYYYYPAPTLCERSYCDNMVWSRVLAQIGSDNVLPHTCEVENWMNAIHPAQISWVVVLCLAPVEQYFERGGSKFTRDFLEVLYHQYCEFHREVVCGIPGQRFTYVYLDMSSGGLEENAHKLYGVMSSIKRGLCGEQLELGI